MQYFAEEFKTKYKISVNGHPKRFLRLQAEVEKLKKMMSTVTTSVPLNLECYTEDKDVRGSIKRFVLGSEGYHWVVILWLCCACTCRDVFIELCSEEISRVKLTLDKVLAKSSELSSPFPSSSSLLPPPPLSSLLLPSSLLLSLPS